MLVSERVVRGNYFRVVNARFICAASKITSM